MGTKRSTFRRGRWNESSSINVILHDYKSFVGVVEGEVERIMLGAAEIVLDYTMPYVPEETGALRESGTARAMRTSKGFAAHVSFGGPENPVSPTKNAPGGIVDYAAVVNYDASKQHGVGEDLFMEKGAAESKDAVDQYIMGELRKIRP